MVYVLWAAHQGDLLCDIRRLGLMKKIILLLALLILISGCAVQEAPAEKVPEPAANVPEAEQEPVDAPQDLIH